MTSPAITPDTDEARYLAGDGPTRWWFTPAVFVLVPVLVSFGAWGLLTAMYAANPEHPDWEKLAGFAVPARVDPAGVLLLVAWYACLITVATVGWRIGSRRPVNARQLAQASTARFERRYFTVILAVAFVGVAYCYYKIGADAVVEAFATQTGNLFTNSLSGSTGVQTLRYATILAAPLGLYLWRKKVIGWPPMVGALVLLILNSLIAHRLSLFMASVVYLVIVGKGLNWTLHTDARHRIHWSRVVLLLFLGLTLLTGLNYVRNANYYRDAGVTNPVAMNVFQMGAYLAVPAQVSLGVSDGIMSGAWVQTGDPVSSITAIRPTFLEIDKVSKDDSWKGPEVYGNTVNFAPNFFTNSVFADTYAAFGLWGWLYTFPLYGLAGFFMARLVRFGFAIGASAGIMAYCFVEVWRIQIVSYGFVVFLLLLTVGSAFIAVRWPVRRKVAGVSRSRRAS